MPNNLTKIRPALSSMEPGETCHFPIGRMKTVRTLASELGLMHNRKYMTRTDRSTQVISVTRVV